MNTLFTFVLSAFAFAAATTAQTTTLTPGSNVKLAFSSDQTLCLGALSTEIGAQVVVGKCSTLPFSTFEVLEGSSTSSALGYKFPLVGSAGPVLCLSARGATGSVPLKFDVCQDDGLQLFEYSQPDDELFELFATGTCVTKSGTSATAKPCSAPSINVNQQWVPLAA